MKVKVNELRIGNMVGYMDCKWSVSGILSPQYNCEKLFKGSHLVEITWGSTTNCVIDRIDPIPLTKKWLVTFGFENNGRDKKYFICNGVDCYELWKVGDVFKKWYLSKNDKIISSNIQFVHSLQNIYFALTGKDLTLNLTTIK